MTRRAPLTTPESADDMDARKAAVLAAVVTAHIDTAHPVGSQTIHDSAGITASPATIRSELVALERSGYLQQPHTSAGRVPTEKGYRYFVDHLGRGKLAPPKVQQLSTFISSVQGELKSVYEQISTKLSDVTRYPAVIVGPGHINTTVRDAHLVDFGQRRILIVLTMSDMDVQKLTISLDFDVSTQDVADAAQQLKAILIGTTVRDRIELPAVSTSPARLVRQAVEAIWSEAGETEGEQVFVGGTSKVADSFDTLETTRQVLDVLEKQLVIVSLFKDLLQRGASVSIGSEHGYLPLAECAVVVAPLMIDGQNAGAIGLLGPTRMKYGEAIAAADVVSEQLAGRLSVEAQRG